MLIPFQLQGKDSVDEALDWFALRVKKVVIITLGAEGAIGLEVSTMKKVKVGCAETSTRVTDTTGEFEQIRYTFIRSVKACIWYITKVYVKCGTHINLILY